MDQLLYRLDQVYSNTVNSIFHLIQAFYQNLCIFPIFSMLKNY